MIYRDGWYYLLATHGSCCRGSESGYNIRMGRSRRISGPFLDHTGLDMIQGGGKLAIGSSGRTIAAARAYSIFARCCGKAAGRSPARI